ncbi:MOSC domain-containing protein [Reticulibacter mediterranei]|uniref:MOSC domain-containing protein n=1 Tax=Reticulibacter mediterranei TaxID=2778369 RepID=A0A8J3IRW7_9CHLR|nr:MOSC N-terminal beta barrel domain-containing protein [Reticulibacter mediterranei]GHO95131.1 MOSC domain-containing protein [Reticulibacter mediterranei]
MSDTIVVSALNVYPIKSCAGIALDVAQLGPRGIVHDRSFMLVDREGMLITQREEPRMALIRPAISTHGDLTVQATGMQALTISSNQHGPRYPVTVWKYTGDGIDQGDEIAEWFSRFLSINCRLVLFPNDGVRRSNPKYASREQDQVAFADGYPCLLISEASLIDLNTRLEQPLPMNRFRPNIVVSGTEPYAEDTWRMIRIGEVTFDIVKPCDRCVVTTTDQITTQRGKEPLKTLAKYRQATDNGVMFGQNLTYARPGPIRLGDRVEIITQDAMANFALKGARV